MSEKKTTRARGKSGRADPGCGGFDPVGFPRANPTVRTSWVLTD